VNINLHIERPVLAKVDIAPGLPPVRQTTVDARLLTTGGLSPDLTGGALPRVSVYAIPLNNGAGPDRGQQIAGSVYEGIVA
jgi:hypothetical protein